MRRAPERFSPDEIPLDDYDESEYDTEDMEDPQGLRDADDDESEDIEDTDDDEEESEDDSDDDSFIDDEIVYASDASTSDEEVDETDPTDMTQDDDEDDESETDSDASYHPPSDDE